MTSTHTSDQRTSDQRTPARRPLPFPAGSVVISAQAPAGSPLEDAEVMAALAHAAELGGAAAIRANGAAHVAAIAAVVGVPVLGINKQGNRAGVYITPTFESAAEVVAAGASAVALDGTARPRPDGVPLSELVARIHDELGVAVMADCDSVESAQFAAAAGCDAVATTLAGYVDGSAGPGPDLELLREMATAVSVPVVGEGRFSTPEHVAMAFALGAHAVVVGQAVTNPIETTRALVSAAAAGVDRPHPWVNQRTAAAVISTAVARVTATQSEAIGHAAAIVLAAIEAGGIVQAFGTGHSRGFAMEVAGRAGGLVPANQLAVKDLVLYGGAEPDSILTPEAERDPAIATRILELAALHPADCFMIASNSGGNGATVEMAIEAKRRGHPVIAVTSLEHSSRIASRHPSGKRLFEVADLVIDNGSPFGDAALPLPEPGLGAIVPVSAVTSAFIAQMIAAEVSGALLAHGQRPPVLISANIPGGDEHNEQVRARYGDRIKVGEP